jgi:hypothetical protein
MDLLDMKVMLMTLVDRGLRPTIEDFIRALDWAVIAGHTNDLSGIEAHMERDAKRRLESDKTAV